jgi:hypothetical protein
MQAITQKLELPESHAEIITCQDPFEMAVGSLQGRILEGNIIVKYKFLVN